MGKSTINGHFPWQNVSSPEGKGPLSFMAQNSWTPPMTDPFTVLQYMVLHGSHHQDIFPGIPYIMLNVTI